MSRSRVGVGPPRGRRGDARRGRLALGTGPFLDGLRAVDGEALLAAAAIGVLTTLCCAWRWTIVARGLGVPLSLPAAVAAYYRSTFLNLTLPGGVVGDVHRGVSHGRDVRDVGLGLRAVAWERAAGQVVQARADRRRPARAAVARAVVHARGGGRARRGGRSPSSLLDRARPRGGRSRWARLRTRRGRRRPPGPPGAPGLAGDRARVRAGRPGPRDHVPHRRADGGRHRAAVRAAAARAARHAGHGAAQRRRLGAARGRDRVGFGAAGLGADAGRRDRGRLRRHGARREPAGRARPPGSVAAP